MRALLLVVLALWSCGERTIGAVECETDPLPLCSAVVEKSVCLCRPDADAGD